MATRPLLNNKFLSIVGVFCALILYIPFANAQNDARQKVYNAQSATLDNGLELIVIPNHRAPIVTHMIWYKVGAADEPPGKSGMAHYFEHLMFKGTKTLAPGEFSRIVKKLGGNDNAFTGQDFTAYFQSIAVQHLERMMEMEADRMVNLSVPAKDFASEKNVVLEERRQRTDNKPERIFGEQMQSALFVNHPYGTPVIGWMDEIEKYEWADLEVFYKKWYAPNNAIVIVSGDITLEEALPMAERTYGRLKPKDIEPRIRTQVPPANGQSLMILRDKTINQPSLQNTRLAPSFAQNKDHALALMVLEEILSGGPTTRLYKNLVVEQKKAVSVGLSYSGTALNDGTIDIYGVPATGVSLEELEALIFSEINAVRVNGVTDQEVKDAIQRMQDAAIFARDSVAGPAMNFGYALTTGSTIDDVEFWPQMIGAVTPAQVQEAAQLYLDNDTPWKRPAITGHLLPLEKGDAQDE